MVLEGTPWIVVDTGERITMGSRELEQQCVFCAYACAEVRTAMRDITLAEAAEVAGSVYAEVRADAETAWAVMETVPQVASSRFLQGREHAYDVKFEHDNAVSVPMFFGTTRWSSYRFITIKCDISNRVAIDVIDGCEFDIDDEVSRVFCALLYRHHLRPAEPATGPMSPRASELFIQEHQRRQYTAPRIPTEIAMAFGWRAFLDVNFEDASARIPTALLGLAGGHRVRLSGLAKPDAAADKDDRAAGGKGGAKDRYYHTFAAAPVKLLDYARGFDAVQQAAHAPDASPAAAAAAHAAANGNAESEMAQAYDSIGLEEIQGAVLTPTERQLALTYLNMSEKDFAKSDVVPEGIKYEYFKRHGGLLGVVGDCLVEHTQDYRRAMLAFKKVWMER